MEINDKNISLIQNGKNALSGLYDKEIDLYVTIISENLDKVRFFIKMDDKKIEPRDISKLKGDELIIENLR